MTDRYRTIVADPPWQYPEGFASAVDAPHKQDRDRGAPKASKFERKPLPYSSLTLELIKMLPIAAFADEDCRLFLWTTSRYLPDGFQVLEAWGFSYRQTLVWDKRPNINPLAGGVAASAAEFVLVGSRGHPGVLKRWPSSIVTSRKPRPIHSRKPEVFLDLAEATSPGPYLELFARRNRLGWDTWGNEALEHISL